MAAITPDAGIAKVGGMASTTDGETLRVLVVDDNVDASTSLAILLRRTGHSVEVAYDGLSATRVAQSLKPDVVLLDLALPRMDGFKVLAALRQQADTKHAKIIALTGFGQPADREHTAEAGFDFHLLKPVEFDLIRDLLRGVRKAETPTNGR